VLYDATSLEDTILLRVYGTLITDCGSSSKGCLESISNQNSAANAYADAGWWIYKATSSYDRSVSRDDDRGVNPDADK